MTCPQRISIYGNLIQLCLFTIQESWSPLQSSGPPIQNQRQRYTCSPGLQNKATQVTRTSDQIEKICGNAIHTLKSPNRPNGVCGL
jgi:hypothetical protein